MYNLFTFSIYLSFKFTQTNWHFKMRFQNRTKYKAKRDEVIRAKYVELYRQRFASDYIIELLSAEYKLSLCRVGEIVKPRTIQKQLKQAAQCQN